MTQTCAPLTPQHRAKLASEGNTTFAGYHRFQTVTNDSEWGTVHHGSFEVFFVNRDFGDTGPDGDDYPVGWYWHACFPGCLPDGEPSGPFPTAEGAYLDAIGE